MKKAVHSGDCTIGKGKSLHNSILIFTKLVDFMSYYMINCPKAMLRFGCDLRVGGRMSIVKGVNIIGDSRCLVMRW